MATLGSLVLLVVLCASIYGQIARAQPSQEGFLYIACGADTGFADPATTLVWVPDTDYISTGAVGVANGASPEYNHFRYFRNDTSVRKNCYSLPVTPTTNYTVRATFFYQNQQVLGDVAPSFQLAVDGTIVANVTTNFNSPVNREVTYQSGTGTSTSLCLLSGPQDVGPRFISAIALRPASMLYRRFSRYLDDKKIIRNRARLNFGGTDITRFPQDYNDRIWSPVGPNSTFYFANSTAPVQGLNTTNKMNMTLYGNFVPENVLQTAVTVQNGNLTINLRVFSEDSHMILHFAELDNHTSNVSRKFLVKVPGIENDSYVNARNFSGEPYKPFYWYFWNLVLTEYSRITFYSMPRSRLGPLINALELFTLYDITSSTTLDQDVQAIESLKVGWNLSEWTGDPCVPVPHAWLSCSSISPTDLAKQPRVQTLDLSGYNLTGAIPATAIASLDLNTLLLNNNSLSGTFPNFTALRNLQTLHLQNNQLSGPLPVSLVAMPSLRQLNVQNNNFSGTIPAQLLAPPFNLTYRPGNPFLQEPGVSPTNSPSRNMAAKSVGHVSAGVVVSIAVLTSLYM